MVTLGQAGGYLGADASELWKPLVKSYVLACHTVAGPRMISSPYYAGLNKAPLGAGSGAPLPPPDRDIGPGLT